jgi:hypothetical protein
MTSVKPSKMHGCARSLGVKQLAVVISKLDTCDYSQVSVIEHQPALCMDGMCHLSCLGGVLSQLDLMVGV